MFQTAVLAAAKLAATPNSDLDYVTAISTAVAAIGTLLAVLVALYLSSWRERRLRPNLRLVISPRGNIGVGFRRHPEMAPFFQPLSFELSNATGHRTAYDTEVLVTVETDIADTQERAPALATDRPLVWAFGDKPMGIGQARVDVPPGVTRSLTVAYLGHPWSLAEAIYPGSPEPVENSDNMADFFGVFGLYPLQQDSLVFLSDNLYHVTFVVTARDTDARRYTSDLTFVIEDQGDNRLVGAAWTTLTQVST
jgi:hypothetical protein